LSSSRNGFVKWAGYGIRGIEVLMTGLQLIEMCRKFLRRYVAMSPAQELTLAIWCLHTWVYDKLALTTPYIEVTGASGSGKSALMDACMLLSRGAELVTTIRTLYMCRRIAETEGALTLFVDEAERLSSGAFNDQRAMLASGYRKGAVHGVSVGHATVRFPTYCPKMFATTRSMTPILHNRAIPIWMLTGRPEAHLNVTEMARAEAVAGEIIAQFKDVVKQHPRFIGIDADWLKNERDREIWTPLVSLAGSIGADKKTMDELIAASVDLSSLRGIERRMDSVPEDENAKERSYAVWLLKDVQSILAPDAEYASAHELVDALRSLPASPWRTYGNAGLNEITLAQLLGAFGLKSDVRTIGKGRKNRKQFRAYLASEIRKAKHEM
jgi:hypothetical protein